MKGWDKKELIRNLQLLKDLDDAKALTVFEGAPASLRDSITFDRKTDGKAF
jgi:hypothetical protein